MGAIVGQNINMRVVDGDAKTCSLQFSKSAGESLSSVTLVDFLYRSGILTYEALLHTDILEEHKTTTCYFYHLKYFG